MIPCIRSGREKNRSVLDTPIVNVKPVRKRISPSASMAESNKKRQPRKRKTQPRISSPVPIFVLSFIMVYRSCKSVVNQECSAWVSLVFVVLISGLADLSNRNVLFGHRRSCCGAQSGICGKRPGVWSVRIRF